MIIRFFCESRLFSSRRYSSHREWFDEVGIACFSDRFLHMSVGVIEMPWDIVWIRLVTVLVRRLPYFFSNVYVVELWGTLIPENESYKWKAFVDVSADCHTERAEKFHNVLIVFHRRLWFFFTISESQHTERRRTKLDVELWVTLERITVSKWETRPFISLPCTHGARKISVFLANVRNIFSHPLRFRFFYAYGRSLTESKRLSGYKVFLYYEKWDPYPIILVFTYLVAPMCAHVYTFQDSTSRLYR